MTTYSHTRLETFSNCPLQYRFKYIDKIETPFEQTDSTFLGSRCHEALEKLYTDKTKGKIDSKEEIIDFFNEEWNEKYDQDTILHTETDKSGEYYRRLGIGWIERFYDDFFVNDRMEILGIETDDKLKLPNGDDYYIRIDKLGFMDGTYYVCDYKTDRKHKDQATADADRQLAMYALWVKKTFPDAEKVILLWQMLRFSGNDAQVTSLRTLDQLDELEKDIVEKIKMIESTNEFLPSDDAYCDYCVYKGMCPKFYPPVILTSEDAKILADEFIQNKSEMSRLEKRNDELEKQLSEIISENECDLIQGTVRNLSVKKTRSVDYSDKDKLISEMKENGLYDRYLKFDLRSVTKDIQDNAADISIMKYATVKDKYSFRTVNKKNDKEK